VTGLCSRRADGSLWTSVLEMPAKVGVGGMTVERRVRRLARIARELRTEIQMRKPHVVAFEGYAYASTHKSEVQAELGGVARYLTLTDFGLLPLVIEPATARKLVLGHGGLSKAKVADRVTRLGLRFASDDMRDAWVIMQAAELMFWPPEALGVEERAIVKALWARNGWDGGGGAWGT
jgi:Holliday junction resolvasome RuvABC endonuclease subunit